MYWTFPSSLKGMALDWFYFFSSLFFQNFEEVSDACFNQYTLRQEFKNNHLLAIKMKPRETLKCYISYFQNQMVMIYNCSDDVAAVAFIIWLQTDHFFYKHLVKHDITNTKEILSRAQKYVQLEEATWGSTTRPPKQESDIEKRKPRSVPPKKTQNRGQNGFKKRSQPSSSRNPIEVCGVDTSLTQFKTPSTRSLALFRTNPGWDVLDSFCLTWRVLESETAALPWLDGLPYSRLSTLLEAALGACQSGVPQGVHFEPQRALEGQDAGGSWNSVAKESDESFPCRL